MERNLQRLAGIGALVAAIAAAVFWPIHPMGWAQPGAAHDAAYFAAVTSTRYGVAYDLLIVVMVASAIVYAALVPLLAPRVGRWLVWTLPVALLGFVLMASAGVFNAHIAPALAHDAATQGLLELRGPLLGGTLHGVFAIGGLLFAAANIVLAVVLERSKSLEFIFAGALTVGAIGVGLHPMLGPVLRSIGFGLFALAYLRLAVACWRGAIAP
ncbi:MAG: hypothetical protein ABI439_04720 [Rhodospirillales bacterium]